MVGVGISVGLLAALWSFTRSDRICRGVVVSGVAIGGMSRADASAALNQWHRDLSNRIITLTAMDGRWQGTLKDLDARADTRAALDRAFSIGRTGGLVERIRCALSSGGEGKRYRIRFDVDPKKLGAAIAQVARHVDKPHRDASLRILDGRLQVRPEALGVKVDRERSLKDVSRALASGLVVVRLPLVSDKPNVTAADAAGIDTLLATHTTSFNPAKHGRTHNLTLAARSISGIILKPGDRFSANAAIGPRERSRGYRDAIIFVRGRMEEGLGGGTCQVSSTLYNAVLLAGLKVVERSHHSRTVPYVPPGLDATVAYGLLDFRFENSNSSPIGLVTTVKGSRLRVDIYGSAADKRQIRLYTASRRTAAAGSKTVLDKSLAPGVRKVLEPASPGVSVTVYREITQPDGTAKREVVSRDRYGAQGAVIAVGPPVRTAKLATPDEATP